MRKEEAHLIFQRLASLYPDARCSLDWTTPLELLVATILSAQCTDKRVNIVTKTLFQKYKTPADYLKVPLEELEQDIHSCGTYRMKAKSIRETCGLLLRDFGGEVPKTMHELLTLRGVGRKTASIVLSTAYGIEEGIPVDTHVMRLSKRLGLTRSTVQGIIESDLMKLFPRKDWSMVSHLLVFHGRQVCTARGHECQCRKILLAPTFKKELFAKPHSKGGNTKYEVRNTKRKGGAF